MDLLSKALHDVIPHWEGHLPQTDAHRLIHEEHAAALRNHPDRLRIAAELLTAEDVARALHSTFTSPHRIDTIDPVRGFGADASYFLAALRGEHSDD